MQQDYKKIIPLRFQNASYEDDVSPKIKETTIKQIRTRSGLYIWGLPGTGKTHLVCALIKNIVKEGFEVKFYNTGDFLEKLRGEFSDGFSHEDGYPGLFREIMDFKGILVFDDIGAEKITDWARERLYLVINKKYEDMVPVFFTSNCDMEILSARLGDRLASRIRGMVYIFEKTGPDRRLDNAKNI